MTDYAQTHWVLPEKDAPTLGTLAETILQRRGYSTEEREIILNPRYDSLGDPYLLPDMEKAVQHILDARRGSAPVIIYGDYDIDGLTASTLLADVFTSLNIPHEIYIPDRFEEGYGIHVDALHKLREQGVSLVVSVDCGSSALAAAQEAERIGLHLIITDHHTLVLEDIPGAIAHINPLRKASQYPERHLAGVGVAFALARALQQSRQQDLPQGQEKWLLDLVALGTICDVVPLVGENRVLAAYGLQVMRKSRRIGLRALAEVSGIQLGDVVAEDLGFKFGPRLNAAGRLEHAKHGLRLLTAKSPVEARKSAAYLQSLNAQRQADTRLIQAAARAQALDQLDEPVLVLVDESWSHGIVGLVASRMSEEFRRPAILLQSQDGVARGSGRSYANISLIDAMQQQEDLFEKFGGHKAAAGMTLASSNIPRLQERLSAYVLGLDDEVWVKEERVDAWLQPEYTTLDGYADLQRLEPTGQAHPGVRFVVDAEITGLRAVGQDGAHYQMRLTDAAGVEYKAIAFHAADRWPTLTQGDMIRAIIRVSKSVWQGAPRVELILTDILLEEKNDDNEA